MSTMQPVNRPSTSAESIREKITEPTVTAAPLDSGGAAEHHHFLAGLPAHPVDWLSRVAANYGMTVLRCVLALVYVWFGVLKVAGKSDVFGLVQATIPFFDAHWFVPTLGCVEILLGVGLFVGRARRLVLCGIVGHLVGTFLTFLDAPSWMMHNSNPLLLNMNGEFVLKNLVLITAALVLLGATTSTSSWHGIRLTFHRQPSAGEAPIPRAGA
jgi:putative oxidoreductase